MCVCVCLAVFYSVLLSILSLVFSSPLWLCHLHHVSTFSPTMHWDQFSTGCFSHSDVNPSGSELRGLMTVFLVWPPPTTTKPPHPPPHTLTLLEVGVWGHKRNCFNKTATSNALKIVSRLTSDCFMAPAVGHLPKLFWGGHWKQADSKHLPHQFCNVHFKVGKYEMRYFAHFYFCNVKCNLCFWKTDQLECLEFISWE